MPEYIVGVRVRKPEDRTDYQELGLAEGFAGYVRVSQVEPEPGMETEYVQEFSPEQLEEVQARIADGRVGNVRFLEENGETSTDELEVVEIPEEEKAEIAAGAGRVPEAASLEFMGADGLTEEGWDGSGVKIAVLDGGTSRAWRRATGIEPETSWDFVNGHAKTYEQVEDGGTHHGCLVAPHCVPPRADYIEIVMTRANGTSTYAMMARCIRWAADQGADVINISSSGPSRSATIAAAIAYANDKGAVVVASWGNDERYTVAVTPAGEEGVFGSIAFTHGDRRAGFSAYHESAEGCAPGHRVISYDRNGNLVRWSGTSASSPNQAGLVVMGATRGNGKPCHVAGTVTRALQNTARDTPEDTREEGAGAWNLRRALAKLEPSKPAPDPPTEESSPVLDWLRGEIERFERYLGGRDNQAARNVLDYLRRRLEGMA